MIGYGHMPEKRALHTLYLALGSNLGDRMDNLRRAVAALAPDICIKEMSPIYETTPTYVPDQPDFYNVACRAMTHLSPEETLRRLKDIEGAVGRVPGPRFGPRIVDVDILFYDDLQVNSPELTIPHARAHERAFVLVPLSDIAPTRLHPTLKMTVTTLLERLGDFSHDVRKLEIAL